MKCFSPPHCLSDGLQRAYYFVLLWNILRPLELIYIHSYPTLTESKLMSVPETRSREARRTSTLPTRRLMPEALLPVRAKDTNVSVTIKFIPVHSFIDGQLIVKVDICIGKQQQQQRQKQKYSVLNLQSIVQPALS